MAQLPIVLGLEGSAVYDLLMLQIEPELTSKQVGTLSAKYATETEAEKKQRMARYAKALAAYKVAFEDYVARWKVAMRNLQKDISHLVEETLQENS